MNQEKINALRNFMTTFEASQDPALWDKLIAEELAEVREAVVNLAKELADVEYVMTGYILASGEDSVPVKRMVQLEAIAFVLENLCGHNTEMRQQVFQFVDESNLSKLDDDGNPIRRDDGKILKGPNYVPAEQTIREFLFGPMAKPAATN
ncbi:pyrophosphohydrolase domain-containing protein [Roseibium alexandrii]|uniref:Phosphoribosyl-ATP pyrophosphohydrolase n=1 Tax=Roseibium alexandrii (strain DSM 17067 / NCIMB 14079 / DFL-11) TaxID=244592 RepID=A0A5E8GSM1_ROSAD|nr:hypothetical protein [Roseibium alexandrii]EEE42878.1 Phosphoribosyl-ATP pyrophosphohydrolase [Roseibium alexandrii DFL-11]